MKWIMGLWYRRLRGIDLKILWPACVRQASSLDVARGAFALHAFNDKAWLFLGEQAIYDAIDGLR